MLDLLTGHLADPVAQENFQKIGLYVKTEEVLKTGFKHFAETYTTTGTFIIKHRLGFIPTDLLQSSIFGTGTVVWNYNSFTEENLSVTIGGTVSQTVPTVVRFFLGRYSL